MGGNQSHTRKLTVENDDPTSVIKVSDDVVQRITNSQEVRPAPAVIQPVIQQQSQKSEPQPPDFVYEPSLTITQLKQSNLTELKKNDRYWEKRLKAQQANHQKINQVLDEEYQRALSEMEVSENSKPITALPPCQEAKEAVMQCYKANSTQPMNCAKVVQAFQECVDSKRISLIANRG